MDASFSFFILHKSKCFVQLFAKYHNFLNTIKAKYCFNEENINLLKLNVKQICDSQLKYVNTLIYFLLI